MLRRVKIGHLMSLDPCPKRAVEVRISSDELFSAISDPPGAIRGSEVVGYDVVTKHRWWRAPIHHLYVRLSGSRSVLFYTAVKQIDVALLLDEFGASFRDVQHSWENA